MVFPSIQIAVHIVCRVVCLLMVDFQPLLLSLGVGDHLPSSVSAKRGKGVWSNADRELSCTSTISHIRHWADYKDYKGITVIGRGNRRHILHFLLICCCHQII